MYNFFMQLTFFLLQFIFHFSYTTFKNFLFFYSFFFLIFLYVVSLCLVVCKLGDVKALLPLS
jgi:hypothetical protein